MIDREKVIKGFEVCLKNIDQPDCPNDCPYLSDCSKYENRVVFQPLMRDALDLLKEQEAKWVEDKQDEHCRLIKCSNCGLTFIVGNNIPYDEWIEDRNYCMRCGAKMEGDQRNEQ